MKTFIITYVKQSGVRVKEQIETTSMQLAIRMFLSRRSAAGLSEAITFNVIKLQVN